MNEKEKELLRLRIKMGKIQAGFPMFVAVCALEVTEIAKQIAPAIGGEISVDEAIETIIREFSDRMKSR